MDTTTTNSAVSHRIRHKCPICVGACETQVSSCMSNKGMVPLNFKCLLHSELQQPSSSDRVGARKFIKLVTDHYKNQLGSMTRKLADPHI